MYVDGQGFPFAVAFRGDIWIDNLYVGLSVKGAIFGILQHFTIMYLRRFLLFPCHILRMQMSIPSTWQNNVEE